MFFRDKNIIRIHYIALLTNIFINSWKHRYLIGRYH